MGKMKGFCTVDGCSKPLLGRGMCSMHYRRWYLYGDPTTKIQDQVHGRTLKDRLMARVEKTPTCWNWTGAANNKGYGQIRVNDDGAPRLVHRVSYEIHCEPIPEGAFVLHKCDNPRCVRPSHLFLGDQVANMADKMAKKRHRYGKNQGEAHGGAKITEAVVREIRASPETTVALAKRFNISQAQAWAIKNRKSWAHIPD